MNRFAVQGPLTGMNAIMMTQPEMNSWSPVGSSQADKSRADKEAADRIDRQLLQDIADNRNRTSLEQFYRRYQPRLLPFLQRMTPDIALTEEVYNDVMLAVWDNASAFRGQSKVSSWVFSIAYRACLKRLKRNGLYQKLKDLLQVADPEEDAPLHNEASQFESGDLIYKALQTLPSKQRIVVELAYFEGYSVNEIADIVDCPTNSVKTRLFHARKKLSTYISAQEGASDYANTISL